MTGRSTAEGAPGVGSSRHPMQTRRRGETRRRLMSAAYEVFTEHGIAEAPIELICERAGFTRGAFYSNFSSKEDLFLAIFAERMREQFGKISTAFDEVTDGISVRDEATVRELVRTITTVYMDPIVNDKQWYVLIMELRSHALRNPELRDQVNTVISNSYDELAVMLTTMCARMGITLTIPPRDAAIVLCSLYETALERAMFEGIESPTESPLLAETLPQLLASSLLRLPAH